MQETNMTHFLQATEFDVYMYAKFECLYVHIFL
jgi:hypothetical protein